MIKDFDKVLILVVVDDGLVLKDFEVTKKMFYVLILVVVDDGLVQAFRVQLRIAYSGLNPCCSGRWSRTSVTDYKKCLIVES